MSAGTRKGKIFGIGLSKTGTTSLARALEILGYRTRDYLGVTRYTAGDLGSIDLEAIDNNDALTDTPIPSFYRELDDRYPGSRFILTVREETGWLKSCQKQFTQKLADKQNQASNQVFMDLYGCTVFDEEKFKAGYQRFVDGVKTYFKDRPQDLLILDVTGGDGWEQLCPFLGKEIPEVPFPRANVTRIRWMDINQLVEPAREAGGVIARAMATIRAQESGERRGSIFSGIAYAVRGGAPGIQARAVKKAHHILLERLTALNPQIPVINRDQHDIDYVERSKWNHYWLLDLPGEEDDLLATARTLTFSIALIEDRRPIMGLVCAPEMGSICYAAAGKAASRVSMQGEPEPLRLQPGACAGDSLAGCLCRGFLPDAERRLEDTMEWQTAAAQVILDASGQHLVTDAGAPVSYNKKQPANGPLNLVSR